MTKMLWTVGLLLLGGATWTFLEYGIHNWVGHLGKGKNEFSREHLKHHAKGNYFAPWWRKLPTALFVLVPMATVVSLVLGAWIGVTYTFGIALAYLGYEVAHRRAHTHPPRGFYSRWMRRHHFYHHFMNPKLNHGVTTPIWDLLFRTYQTPEKIRVPQKLAMEWLCDPETGEVKDAYADDYFIHKRKTSTKTPLAKAA